MPEKQVTTTFIWNYPGGRDGCISCVAVQAEAYSAYWYHENPTAIVVRDPRFEGAGWVTLRLGGWCEEATEGGIVAHTPSTFVVPHAADVDLARRLKGRKVSDRVDLVVRAEGSAIGDYTYQVVFYSDRIELITSIELTRPVALARCVVGLSPDGKRSAFFANSIYDPSPAPHGMSYHTPDQPLTMYHQWFSPAPFCYPLGLQDGTWMSVSLEPRPDQMRFTRFCTDPDENGNLAFGIRYEGHPTFDKHYESPAVVMRFGAADAYASLRQHAKGVVAAGKVAPIQREAAEWWQGVMVCGWMAQTPGGTGFATAGGFAGCTQALYEAHVAKYTEVGIEFDILTIDAGWQTSWGLWEVDQTKWPDLRGFIDQQHALGRKVLLWLSPQTDGLPEDELYRVGDRQLLDPNNQSWLARLGKCCQQLLGSGPDSCDADGIKLDGTGGMPPPGKPVTTKELHGMEYLHAQLQAIHDAAKAAKSDCLLDFEIANPHFAALHDMCRLNDFFLPVDMALMVMRERARVAQAVGFGLAVDTDHPAHEEYFRHSQEFGNISLYLTDKDLKNPKLVTAIKEGIAISRARVQSARTIRK